MLAVVLATLAKLVAILKLGLRSISKRITSLTFLNIYTLPKHALNIQVCHGFEKICKKWPICAKFKPDIVYIQVCHGFEKICKKWRIWAKFKLDNVYTQVILCWQNGLLILGMNTIYLIHISPLFMSPKSTLPTKAKKPPSILLKYP